MNLDTGRDQNQQMRVRGVDQPEMSGGESGGEVKRIRGPILVANP